MKRFFRRPLRIYVSSAVCTAWFRIRGIASPVIVCDGRLPILYSKGKITIGKRFCIRGRISPCEIGSATETAELSIGSGVFINQGASVVAYSKIEIGDDTLIGDFVAIYDTNYHPIDMTHATRQAPVIIGSNVWLGRGTLVLPGSKIGDHTVVAAGSIVKSELPARVLAAGNPARAIKHLEVSDGWARQ